MQLMSIKIGLLSVLLIKTCVRKKGGLGGFAPQTLTRSYYFEPPLSKKRSRATAFVCQASVKEFVDLSVRSIMKVVVVFSLGLSQFACTSQLTFWVKLRFERNFDFESAVGFCAVVMQNSTKTKRGILLYIDSSQDFFY